MRSVRICVLLLCGVFNPSHTDAQEQREIKARTLCFSRVDDKSNIFISSGKGEHQIMLPVNRHSPEFRCLLTNNQAVFYKQEGIDVKGKPRRKVVARAKVPTSMRKVLFYFIPSSNSRNKLYDVRVMDDDLAAFPMGNTRALNLFDGEVGIQLGEHLRRVKSGAMINVPAVKKKNVHNMAPVTCLVHAKDGKWRTISEMQMHFSNKKRILVVCYFDVKTQRPRLRIYKDIPRPVEPIADP